MLTRAKVANMKIVMEPLRNPSETLSTDDFKKLLVLAKILNHKSMHVIKDKNKMK